MFKKLLRLFSYVRTLEKDVVRLLDDLHALNDGRTTIYDLAIRDGQITAEFGTEVSRVLAGQFAAVLNDKQAPNWLEADRQVAEQFGLDWPEDYRNATIITQPEKEEEAVA